MIDISIIVPYYKDYQRLLSLLSTLNEQTLPKSKWEILLINNDSAQPLILNEFFFQNLPLFIYSESKPGSYAARNKGISKAKGKVLAFTDSDCLPDKDWLKNAYDFFQNDFKHEIGVLTGPIQLFYKNHNSLSDTEIFEKYTAFTTEAYSKSGRAITANWFSYADVIREFNGFDSTLKSNGDSELSGRISQRYQVAYKDNIIIKHPARYELDELKSKYRRLVGGKFTRKFKGKNGRFLVYVIDFCLRQYRFAFKKFLTIPLKEGMAIFKVCNSLNWVVLNEYVDLVKGKETKR
jgi:glycosyltransferase involved in cell wall biosynthesis